MMKYSFSRYVKRYKKFFILGSLFKLLETIVELLIPFFMIDIIVNATAPDGASFALSMSGVMLFLIVVGMTLAAFGQYFSAQAAAAVSRKMRSELYERINSMEYECLDKHGATALINRLTNDVRVIQGAVLIFVRIALRAPFLIIGAVIFSMIINWQAGLIILALIPFLAISFYLISKKLFPRYEKIQSTLDDTANKSKEYVEGMRVVRAFAKEDTEKANFSILTDKYADMTIGAEKLSGLLSPINTLIINLGVLAIIYLIGLLVQNQAAIELAEISALVTYMVQIVLALNMLNHLTIRLVRGAASNKRIAEVYDTDSCGMLGEKPQINALSAVSCKKSDSTSPILRFSDACFRYSKSNFALSNISFELMQGQTLGIVGGTGSGKTTLVNLVPRFYEIDSGAIYFKGIDSGNLDLDTLRGAVAIAEQNAAVFSGTFFDNIRFGKPCLDDEGVYRAAGIAEAHEFIQKRQKGYFDSVEQGGKNLSGGQRQRISLARAIAKGADILILDDALNALDYQTLSRLKKSLKKLDGITQIITSQRVSQVMDADLILVLEKGMLVGCGRHEELSQECQVYKNIMESEL